MPQSNRLFYQQDTRTEAERDADTKAWVKAHTTDYRQTQAASAVPPEDPSGGHGGYYRPDDDRDKPSNMTEWIERHRVIIIAAAVALIVGNIILAIVRNM